MPPPRVLTIAKISIIATRFAETLAFYQRLGLDIPVVIGEPSETRHAPAQNGETDFAVDNDALARLYTAEWRGPHPGHSVLLTAQCASRSDVDTLYHEIVGAGYVAIQPPYDAFWGARFAIVADPEGNPVGLESPADAAYRLWPPTPSPDP
ncbi:MAG: VOC family protein [Anaerolineaceae bacterium]|nr:VOC family protein [Anaerolineaceae bacterium]